jgi:nucleoside-diphosphate-sugar epimerase
VRLANRWFYGPGRWFSPEGDVGDQVRQRQVPVIADGQGVTSRVHIEDAAAATVAALDCAPGAYNIVDDDPVEQRVWLLAFAKQCGAPDPPHATEDQATRVGGPDAVYYAARLRAAPQTRRQNGSLILSPGVLSGWSNLPDTNHDFILESGRERRSYDREK